MQINWFTVIAQVLNFFLLVWLLKRFLYKQILGAIDEREKKIVSQIEEANTNKAEAKKEREEFEQKNEAFEKEKKERMLKVSTDAETEGRKLLEKVRSDAEALRSKLEKALIETQVNLNKEIAERTQKEVFSIARKALSDLASVSLEEQSANIFIQRINELGEKEKKEFREAFQSAKNPILVKSTYGLPDKQQADIKKSINEIVGADASLIFQTTTELISGIELSANGYKFSWSISEYLSTLEKSIAETLSKQLNEKPGQKAEAESAKPAATEETPATEKK